MTISAPKTLADVAIDSDTAPIPPENRENDENRFIEGFENHTATFNLRYFVMIF